MMTNKLRKQLLAAIARDRLGYQEYLDMRDAIDKTITTMYDKLQKKSMPKSSKKKKKSGEPNGSSSTAGAATTNGIPTNISSLPPCPAALGLEPDHEFHLGVPEQLTKLVQTRRKWVDEIGRHFVAMEEESPGRIYGLPKESVFQGIDEEVKKYLASLPATFYASASSSGSAQQNAASSSSSAVAPAGGQNGKGKARALGDDMQLG